MLSFISKSSSMFLPITSVELWPSQSIERCLVMQTVMLHSITHLRRQNCLVGIDITSCTFLRPTHWPAFARPFYSAMLCHANPASRFARVLRELRVLLRNFTQNSPLFSKNSHFASESIGRCYVFHKSLRKLFLYESIQTADHKTKQLKSRGFQNCLTASKFLEFIPVTPHSTAISYTLNRINSAEHSKTSTI